MKNKPYLQEIKAFLEGTKDLTEWYDWWQKNKQQIKKQEQVMVVLFLDDGLDFIPHLRSYYNHV